ncbi:terminase large subunit [Neptuniibacter sp.]|uniref:terminase large subunit n=1 Tax=Neptuniibacter sp. TaxID=1962643 RepID=UPI002632C96D|nr:terminase large subunit [Neptuniibacter sp.]MCP4597786.1 terminase large subunit [Neptuniibacter sp.]
MASYPNVNAANKYARDVVAGRIPACRYVILACKRHLADLKESKKKNFKFKFDKDEAERACKFVQLLPHTKGKWAQQRLKLVLEPWQLFQFCCVFGWKVKKTGLRRFREAYSEIARKNGKSAIAAGAGLFLFAADDEAGAEVYSGATTEKQAWEVFRPARQMCLRTPDLTSYFGIEVNAKNLNRPTDDARFEPVIGDPGDGSSPHGVIVDEYHEHRDNSLYDTMITGMGAREQPLLWAITTAGFDIAGPCYEHRQRCIEMLEGITPDDELFGIIYTIDEGDDWTTPEALRKANPNMGVSVYEDYLLGQQQRAIKNPRHVNTFKTKHLNLWVQSKTAFFNMEKWKECEDKSLSLDQFQGEECIFGLDLARKLDMNSGVPLFKREIDGRVHYYCVSPYFWIPEDTVFDNDNKRLSERYQAWVNQQVMIPTDGAEIDYREILASVQDITETSPVVETPIDPHGATNLSHNLADEGLSPITITQNYTNLSDPMKELEAAINNGRFHHDGNPIMTWCISNTVGKHLPGNDDVVRPVKEVGDNKIDGAVALIMAIGRSMLSEGREDTLSDHLETHGIRTL